MEQEKKKTKTKFHFFSPCDETTDITHTTQPDIFFLHRATVWGGRNYCHCNYCHHFLTHLLFVQVVHGDITVHTLKCNTDDTISLCISVLFEHTQHILSMMIFKTTINRNVKFSYCFFSSCSQ